MVRLLFEAAERPPLALSANDGVDALDAMPLDVSDVVLKSHGMDQRLLKFARVAGAKLVISTRDPRDSVVSQKERFGSSLHQAAMDISRALATITSLPTDIPVLRLAYEDRFTERPETIVAIAVFLGIAVSDRSVCHIFESLRPDKVRRRITRWLATFPADVALFQNPVEQWHAQHISDGRVGKWADRLDLVSQVVVTGCLSAMMPAEFRRGEPLMWSAQLFTNSACITDEATFEFACTGAAQLLSYGPYLCLMRGRWRATALIWSKTRRQVAVEADIYLPWGDHRIAHWIGSVSEGAPSIVVEFEHHDYYQPLEARLMSVDGSDGRLAFLGWQFHWLGPID